MKTRLGIARETLVRCILSAISGLALAAAYPKADLGLLAWIAFVPLLYAIEDQPLARVFAYAWMQGLICYGVSMRWVLRPLRDLGGIAFVPASSLFLLLAALLAVYGASAVVAGVHLSRRFALPLFLTLPATWVAAEWVRTYWPLGFPCNLLGDAAHGELAVIQIAEFTGVYGLSALIMLVNCALFEAARRRRSIGARLAILSGTSAVVAAVLVFGILRMRGLDHQKPDGTLRVAMIQGDISEHQKWNPSYIGPSLKIYANGSRSASLDHVQLIIWPETAAPFIFQPNAFYPAAMDGQRAYRGELLRLARKIDTPILFGAPALQFGRKVELRNRAYLITAGGQVDAYYDKLRLAPIGEYVPLPFILKHFVHRLVQTAGNLDFSPGHRATIFHVNGTKFAVLICYESIFPDLSRKAVEGGANVLVNLSNDAAFGRTSEPYQVLAMSVFRAVENRVPLVRVTNSGISAVITPTGRVTAATKLFTRMTEIENVSWRHTRTVYTKVGDLFAELCLVLSLVGLAATWLGAGRAAGSVPRLRRGEAHSRQSSEP